MTGVQDFICYDGLAMTSEDLVDCLGQFSASFALQRLLAVLGMKVGSKEARYEAKKKGVTVAFKSLKKGGVVFNSVTFHSGTHGGFAGFAAALPGGVAFGDTRPQVIAKLGPSATDTWRWKKGTLQLTVRFSRNEPQIVDALTIQLPAQR